jgi:predicted dehydrogenase
VSSGSLKIPETTAFLAIYRNHIFQEGYFSIRIEYTIFMKSEFIYDRRKDIKMFRAALIGAGRFGMRHLSSYKEIENVQITGVMDIQEEKAQYAADFMNTTAYASMTEMLEKEEPDILDICLPTSCRYDIIKQACKFPLRAIFVEKPMGRTAAECEMIIDECHHAGIRLFVGHILRYFPQYAEAKRQIDSGAVGQVVTVRSRRGGPFPDASSPWYADFEQSGGVSLDLMIHDFDWLRWCLGDPQRVFAKGLVTGKTSNEPMQRDYSLVTIRFRSGAIAHVEGSWADPAGFRTGFEIAGDLGLLEFNFNLQSPSFFEIRDKNGSHTPSVDSHPCTAELNDFLHALDANVPARVSSQDALEAVRIAEAAMESMRTGKPVSFT